jgi:hypothetical protein
MPADDLRVLIVARALNVEAGRQMGLTDEDDWETITDREREGWISCATAALVALDPAGQLAQAAEERDHFRRALIRIGNNESGHWGVIAREALRPAHNSKEPLS